MKKILLFSIIALFSLSLFTSCTEQNETPKYIFLFIGDGMGLGQQQLTESYLGAYNSTYPDPKLYFTSLPQKGFITTYSKSHKITDSAAAGTALAGGEKTDNGMIMKSGDGTEEYYSVAEVAKDLEMKVGIISSVSLDHATPAVFYANADSRNMYYEISMQLPDSDFDFFGGGGFKNPEGLDTEKKYSENYTHQDSEGEVVADNKNMLEYAREKGYTIINTKEDFNSLKHGDEKVIAINPEQQSGAAMTYAIDRNEGELSLADYVRKGIDLLENENGFFMMVEGGKIDWACHSNDGATVIHEVIDFDKAVGEAMKFYLNHPDETLIIVTGDHETGGLGLGSTISGKGNDIALFNNQKASLEVIEKHMSMLTEPTFEQILTEVDSYFGLGTEIALTDYDIKRLRKAYNHTYRGGDGMTESEVSATYGYYDPVTITATHILSEKAGVDWTTYSHTSMPLPVHSIGAGSEVFGGYYDNTDIPKKIIALISE